MSIICLEGISAVGKTTTAEELAHTTNVCVIPEVNLLFERPRKSSNTWYLERQVERWCLAEEKLKDYETVILDGDVFQPLSYNWCFDFQIYNQSLDFISEFYQKAIQAGRIQFPHKYFYLYANETNLRWRKENDQTRTRKNFEKHTGISQSHQRYYEALNQFRPGYVKLLEAASSKEAAKVVFHQRPLAAKDLNPEILLQNITRWLKENKA
ncbi:hypothetical protein CHL76_08490 [Marinococcus halophilus]|uniref:Chloramphenicol acetyltransferase n=1 Tax=Marinococcus halophilus TaxID=1371 RepID=A0A510Y4D2_MARHA|nr:AAA family ATPase [Marinococcus halophilus]OZT80135.1 hypothetical protein CHL76_08490 [Marinococcus halophilus]GEK58182.1 chloramphenicol acetyltransferase [Marinococcus halophilus]